MHDASAIVAMRERPGAAVGQICALLFWTASRIFWKVKYAGMTVPEARRLKELEAENSKLKRLLADAELGMAALKDLLGRKW